MQSYTDSDHAIWRTLFERMQPRWQRYATGAYLEGLRKLELGPDRIPQLDEVNERLSPLTGFRAIPVSGYLPANEFFACLRRKEFPTVTALRRPDQLDYLPEPDVFHDLMGHVPMHADPAFAAALVQFGETALHVPEQELARLFWFTIEFGLMRGPDGVKVYGSGLLSSYGEIAHAVDSPDVERRPLAIDGVLRQPFEIDHYQPVLYIAESLEQVYGIVSQVAIA